MKKVLVAIAVSAFMYGCSATHGTPISQEKVDSLKVGQTTLSDAIQTFGAPISEAKTPEGMKILSWGYSEVSGFGMQSKSRGVSMVFGKDGKLQSFNQSSF